MPTRANTHVDYPISQMMLRRMLDAEKLLCNKILPTLIVNRSSDIYYKFNNAHLRLENTVVDSRGGANEIDFDFSTATYSVKDYGLKHFIHGKLLRNADEVIKKNLRIATARTVTDLLLVDKEKRCADLLFNTTTFAGKTTALTGSSRWDNASSNPFTDIINAVSTVQLNSGKTPNTIVMGYDVWKAVVNHDEFLGRLGDTSIKSVNISAFKQMLDGVTDNSIQNVLIGSQTYNTAKEGATDSFVYTWGKYVLIAYIDPKSNTVMDQTLGKTFQEAGLNGLQIKYYKETEDQDGEWCRGTTSYDLNVVDSNCGYLYSTVVS